MNRHKSGAAKRKAKKVEEESLRKLTKVTTFFQPVHADIAVDDASEHQNIQPVDSDAMQEQTECVTSVESVGLTDAGSDETVGAKTTFYPLNDDPSEWPECISDEQRCDIVIRGPKQITKEFPYNSSRRRFTAAHYKRRMKNSESVSRSWLLYSDQNDSVFCFCCKLFGSGDSPFRTGMNTWEGLAKKLKQHETGRGHINCFNAWMDLLRGIKKQSTVDQMELQQLMKEREFWRAVIERLIDIVILLSERNLAFRGSNETLGSSSNGNFLGVFELCAKRDPILRELKERIINKETADHYLSNDTQNEIINMVAKHIENLNLSHVKLSKYYSIILDCTPDISHKEQMTLIIRYVNCMPGSGAEIKESFFGYINVVDTTGEGLLESFLTKMRELGLDVADCRGQSYDNGANMKGKNAGVQARLLRLNSKAFYLPCANHSLNLVITDAAKSSTHAINFFGILNRLYNIFAGSPARWEIINKNVPLAIKRQSDTRWESRVNCVKPLRYYLPNIISALEELVALSIQKQDGTVSSDAQSILENVSSWSFILSIVIWYEVLFHVNKASKLLQKKGASLEVVQTEIRTTYEFLKKYRESGYETARAQAQEMARKIEVEAEFPVTRSRRKKRLFSYENVDDSHDMSMEDKFRCDFFFKLMDESLSSIDERFQQFQHFSDIFGFLCSADQLCETHNRKEIGKCCVRLESCIGDIDAIELEMELDRFHSIIQENDQLKTSGDFLHYIYESELQECYANLAIALRIL